MLCHLPFDASKRLFSPVLSSSRSRPCSSPRSPQLIGGTDAGGEAPDDGTDITPDDIAAMIYHALGIDPLTEYCANSTFMAF